MKNTVIVILVLVSVYFGYKKFKAKKEVSKKEKSSDSDKKEDKQVAKVDPKKPTEVKKEESIDSLFV